VPLGPETSRHTTLGLLTKAKRFIKVSLMDVIKVNLMKNHEVIKSAKDKKFQEIDNSFIFNN